MVAVDVPLDLTALDETVVEAAEEVGAVAPLVSTLFDLFFFAPFAADVVEDALDPPTSCVPIFIKPSHVLLNPTQLLVFRRISAQSARAGERADKKKG